MMSRNFSHLSPRSLQQVCQGLWETSWLIQDSAGSAGTLLDVVLNVINMGPANEGFNCDLHMVMPACSLWRSCRKDSLRAGGMMTLEPFSNKEWSDVRS